MRIYIAILYLITIYFFRKIVIKENKHQAEWLLLLIMLNCIATCIMYLFAGTTVFAVLTVGAVQIHLEDIVIIITLFFVAQNILKPFSSRRYFLSTLLVSIPMILSVIRGIMIQSIEIEVFLSDIRKYLGFLLVLYAAYFLMRTSGSMERMQVIKSYIDIFMNIIFVYVVVIWVLDLGFGINSLPGQKNGMLSDGGSTFRIIQPTHVLMIAFYTLYKIQQDLENTGQISVRMLLFSTLIVLMQWRTVVAAFVVGIIMLVVIFIKERGISFKLFVELLMLVGVVMVLSMQNNGKSDGILGMVFNLFNSYSNMKKNTGTFATRTYVWDMMLSSLHGINRFFGQGFGHGLDIEWKYSAHNGYVDYIVKMGYFGAVCFCAFIAFLIIQSIKKKEYICMIILCAQAIYWYGYGFSLEQGAVLGFILAMQEWKDNKYWNGVAYAE